MKPCVHGNSRADFSRKCKNPRLAPWLPYLWWNITLPNLYQWNKLESSIIFSLIRPRSADTGLDRWLLILLVTTQQSQAVEWGAVIVFPCFFATLPQPRLSWKARWTVKPHFARFLKPSTGVDNCQRKTVSSSHLSGFVPCEVEYKFIWSSMSCSVELCNMTKTFYPDGAHFISRLEKHSEHSSLKFNQYAPKCTHPYVSPLYM